MQYMVNNEKEKNLAIIRYLLRACRGFKARCSNAPLAAIKYNGTDAAFPVIPLIPKHARASNGGAPDSSDSEDRRWRPDNR